MQSIIEIYRIHLNGSIHWEIQSNRQLLFSLTLIDGQYYSNNLYKPINRFHFIFSKKYWQRRYNDSAIIWLASYINQPSSKYLIKVQNKVAIENNRLTSFAFAQLEMMKQNISGLLELMFVFQDTYNLYMCLKHVEGFTLEDIMKVHVFTESETKFVICSLIKIIQSLHSFGYGLVSLDPQSIVFDSRDQQLKLIDMPDLSRLGEPVNIRSVGKSYYYSAPETIQGLPLEMESDYYGLGLIMYEMMTRRKPFILEAKVKQKQELLNHRIEITKSQIPEGWTPAAIDFLIKLLIKNPEYRLGKFGPTQVRQQIWIQSYDWNILNDRSRSKIAIEREKIQRQPCRSITYDLTDQAYSCPVFQSIFQQYNLTSN